MIEASGELFDPHPVAYSSGPPEPTSPGCSATPPCRLSQPTSHHSLQSFLPSLVTRGTPPHKRAAELLNTMSPLKCLTCLHAAPPRIPRWPAILQTPWPKPNECLNLSQETSSGPQPCAPPLGGDADPTSSLIQTRQDPVSHMKDPVLQETPAEGRPPPHSKAPPGPSHRGNGAIQPTDNDQFAWA